MIPFNKATYTGNEDKYVIEAIKSRKIGGNGKYTKLCENWFEKNLNAEKVLLTPSCTSALEMTAILIDIKEGDEVIMPSYTFVSTANAFVMRRAKIVFVDIKPYTMNIDETKIEKAITEKTKAIVPVHYGGVSCEMDKIMKIAEKYNLYVIEDAAQGMMCSYKGRPLGTIGHFGTFSFHETKNYTSGGEGGLLIINDRDFVEKAEIIQEKGTNRSQFFQGKVDKYTWVDVGSSYLMNDLSAAYLWGQLEKAEEINKYRLDVWNYYYKLLKPLELEGFIELPIIPYYCKHNGHIFYIKVKDFNERNNLINYLKSHQVSAVFHYVPLHTSPAGKRFGRFHGKDVFTTKESERLLRLPIFYGITIEEVERIAYLIHDFYVKQEKFAEKETLSNQI